MTSEIDRPYPLKRKFYRQILPALLILLLVIPALSGWGGAGLIETVYLQFAERRASVIDRALIAKAGSIWRELKGSQSPLQVYASQSGSELRQILQNEVKELALTHLKVYGIGGVILFDTETGTIGTSDPSAGFIKAFEEGERSAVLKKLADGTDLYELYVRLPAQSEAPVVVFELYEPTTELNRLLFEAAAPVAISAALALIAIFFALSRLVGQAQIDIDKRTALVVRLRERLEGFVSVSAVTAARASVGSESIQSTRVQLTLFYSDIRGFTSFSENLDPREVINFLNTVMSLQIEIVREEGGDVDKMIGDALLVRFDGAQRQARAIRAALKIQQKMAAGHYPRGLGIGIFSGSAISGTIGPADRQDFTVIGDSVNASARLCSAAGEGEIVADSETVNVSEIEGFGEEEEIVVKGKQIPLKIRRL